MTTIPSQGSRMNAGENESRIKDDHGTKSRIKDDHGTMSRIKDEHR